MPNKKAANTTRAITVANIFGTLGYVAIIIQWMWTLLILCYPLIISKHSILQPIQPLHPVHSGAPSAAATSPLAAIIAIAATIVIMALTVVMLLRLPKQIGQQGARITQQTAEAIVPIVSKHKKLPKKKRLQLSYRLILLVKAILIVIPLAGLLYIPSSVPLAPIVIWTLGLFCAAWSIVYIGLQQLIVIITKSPISKVW